MNTTSRIAIALTCVMVAATPVLAKKDKGDTSDVVIEETEKSNNGNGNGNGNGHEGTGPVEAVDPVDTVEPVDPADPAEPVDPEDPVEIVDPVETDEAGNQGQPSEIAVPTHPEGPVGSVTPPFGDDDIEALRVRIDEMRSKVSGLRDEETLLKIRYHRRQLNHTEYRNALRTLRRKEAISLLKTKKLGDKVTSAVSQ